MKILSEQEIKAVRVKDIDILVDSSLYRIKKYSDNGFFTISTYNHRLMKDLRTLELGYVTLVGRYVEHYEDGTSKNVEELSLFVPYIPAKYSEQMFAEIAETLARKYGQESFLLRLPTDDTVFLCSIEGTGVVKDSLGTFHIDSMGDYYSKLKKGGSQRDIKYVFEGTRHPINVASRTAMYRLGEIF